MAHTQLSHPLGRREGGRAISGILNRNYGQNADTGEMAYRKQRKYPYRSPGAGQGEGVSPEQGCSLTAEARVARTEAVSFQREGYRRGGRGQGHEKGAGPERIRGQER
jgi:hypothetical protein